MKTAIQEAIAEISNISMEDMNERNLKAIVLSILSNKLPTEKKQICQSFSEGYLKGYTQHQTITAEKYYTNTYNN